MPAQPPQPSPPVQPQPSRPWWKGKQLWIPLLIVVFCGAGAFAYLQFSPPRKTPRAHDRPIPIKEEAPGCNIEGILAAHDGPAVMINGNIYSTGETACGGTIAQITLDSITIESQGREKVFSMNVPTELTPLEKTKIQTQKNMEILSKAAGTTFGAKPEEQPAAETPKAERKESKTAVSKTAKVKKVEIFITDWCPYCRQLETFLKSKKIAYERYDIEKNFAGKKKYKSLGGEGVPLVLIGSKVIKGFDPDAIQAELDK